MSYRATDWVSFNADISYLDSKYKSFPNSPCTTLGNVLGSAAGCNPDPLDPTNPVQNLAGKRRAYAPEWSGNIGLRFTVPLKDDVRLTLDPSLYFTTRFFQQATADPLFEQPGYSKIDLRAAVGPESGSWEFAVIAKNLTNKETGSFRSGTVGSTGTYYIGTERPRSVAFQLTFKH